MGFDIDDTVLFSSPFARQKTFSPESEDYLKNPVFWEKIRMAGMNSAFQKRSLAQLIDMHVRRGDAIFFCDWS
ncbi:HAD family acid phosphatase [Escherichia coli]